jgi:hypothetical protein
MTGDPVMEGFLKRQLAAAAEVTASSPLVSIKPIISAAAAAAGLGGLPQHYVAAFTCKGLIRRATGEIAEAERFLVGIYFPPHYLKKPNTFESFALLEPREVFHPNIDGPFICTGEGFMRRSPGLVEIAFRLFAIITWATYSAKDALCPTAAAWARRNQDRRFPIDRRPLRGRALAIELVSATAAAAGWQKAGGVA